MRTQQCSGMYAPASYMSCLYTHSSIAATPSSLQFDAKMATLIFTTRTEIVDDVGDCLKNISPNHDIGACKFSNTPGLKS